MSGVALDDYPSITVNKSGQLVDLPVQSVPQRDGTDRPVAVGRSPKISFPPPIALGEGSVRRNYDIDEEILTDWSGGLGVDRYPPSTPPSGVQYGELDTRTPGYLTPPRLPTDIGTIGGTVVQSRRFLNPNFASAALLSWNPGAGGFYAYAGGTTWNVIASGGTNIACLGVCEGLGYVWAAGITAAFHVFRSSDGVTWTAMAIGGGLTAPSLCQVFDERLWVLDSPGTGVLTAYYSTDIAAAAGGGGTWVAGNSFRVTGYEQLPRLFVWSDPTDRGRPTLWCLTTARLLYYDYYAATPTWKTFFQFRSPFATSANTLLGDAHVWPKNGNLYVCSAANEYITEFTGAQVNTLRINRGGGMPSSQRVAPLTFGSDDDHLYVFCGQSSVDTSTAGAVVAMAEGGTFHHVYRPTTAGHLIAGGHVGDGKLWVGRYETSAFRVLQVDNVDVTIAPHLTTKRSYESLAKSAVSGWLDGGLVNVNKRLLYFEVDALKADGSPGLDTGCAILIEYARRGAGFTSTTTLTSASTFPAVLAISGGYLFKELQVRVTLQRGSTAAQAPFLKALKVGYRPRAKQRYTYSVRVDVRDECKAFDTPDGRFGGYSASYLRQWLDELNDNDDAGQDDPLVGLSYGGQGNLLHPRYRSMPQCEVLIQAQESPDKADGLYLLTFSDVSAPSSG